MLLEIQNDTIPRLLATAQMEVSKSVDVTVPVTLADGQLVIFGRELPTVFTICPVASSIKDSFTAKTLNVRGRAVLAMGSLCLQLARCECCDPSRRVCMHLRFTRSSLEVRPSQSTIPEAISACTSPRHKVKTQCVGHPAQRPLQEADRH